mgnify:CR=1 FL=1
MKSVRLASFIKTFDKLPIEIKRQTVETYIKWKLNPKMLSLDFKNIRKNIYSIRVGLNYRAFAKKDKDTYMWFWIGSHEDYNKMIKQLNSILN